MLLEIAEILKKECSIRNKNHCQAYRSVNLKGHLTQSAKQIHNTKAEFAVQVGTFFAQTYFFP